MTALIITSPTSIRSVLKPGNITRSAFIRRGFYGYGDCWVFAIRMSAMEKVDVVSCGDSRYGAGRRFACWPRHGLGHVRARLTTARQSSISMRDRTIRVGCDRVHLFREALPASGAR